MSVPVELIRIVESAGGRFEVDRDRLGIDPKSAAAPVRAQLIEHKQAIILLLRERETKPAATVVMPQGIDLPPSVRLVQWQPKPAPVRLSPCSVVVDTEKSLFMTLRQLDAHLHGKHWLADNWPLPVLLARLEACGCTVTLEDDRRALQ